MDGPYAYSVLEHGTENLKLKVNQGRDSQEKKLIEKLIEMEF